MKKEQTNWMGITKCCGAEADVEGGGYDGEDIVAIRDFCRECGKTLNVGDWTPQNGKETNNDLPF
mgnify:FL=1